ncbi:MULTISPECIES: tetratricopeptide repeat protein [Cyanophyceae]|uniref:tetratricopeptide repeat protein n=1 Tax=Cyanophyceae TaxID=3028117 RepID=UPI001689F186|nr:tetratricopeptide repeat protein [Trichocoleus sp. FACHB-40]MBD2005553.1 tetratricopeptide repeat protein [Trichocoleus sp. FACHB-40]
MNFYEDDEYELDNSDLQKLADDARDEVLAALLDTFNNTSMLFASLWLSYRQEVNEDNEESEYEYIETASEISIDDLIERHFPVFEWLNDQCCTVFERIKTQSIQTLSQGVYKIELETQESSTGKPQTPFSVETFDLLEQLKEKPTGDFYLAHEEQFKKLVENPFQELTNQVAAQLPDVITNRLELTKARFVSWKNCECSFYSRGLHPNASANLYILITFYSLEFGFFIFSDGLDRARLAANCRIYPQATQIVIQEFPNQCTPLGTNKVSYSRSNLGDWLKYVSRKSRNIKDNIVVYSILSKHEILDCSTEEIAEHINQTFRGLFPLFLLATCNDPIPAIEEYLKSPHKRTDAKELYNQGVEEYQQGNYQESINKFDEALQIEPEFAAAYSYRGKAKAEMEDIHGARADYSKSLRLQGNQSELSHDLGNVHYKLENYQTAIENYNWALDINPSFALAYCNRGRAYLKLEDKQKAIEDLRRAAELFDQQDNIEHNEEVQRILKTIQLDYSEPSFTEICENVRSKGLRISESTLRRYHLALKSRKFVILSGISGTGKTWISKAYAEAVEAEYLLVPVAPNWTTNEDLLGYLSPIDNKYHDTDFSTFLEKAEEEYQEAQAEKRTPSPYHLVLDEMNLARVEYYFAKFLSAMEVRMREGVAQIQLASEKQVLLPPNLYFIGTVNVDETTHSFADKVYDRAQLIELEAPRQDLYEHLGEVSYREMLIKIWDEVHTVAPFAFRVIDEIKTYVKEAETLELSWQDALDEQLLQKILPKLKGADDRVGVALKAFVDIVNEKDFPLSHKKATKMLETFNQHGFTSYF